MTALTVARVGGATFIDTDTGVKDCNLGDIQYQPNAPIRCDLTVPFNHPNLGELLTTPDLLVVSDAVLEVTIDGNLLPRFLLVAATLEERGVRFDLADRRYTLGNGRYVGRTGPPISLVPVFYDATGLPSGWTINPGAPDTITVTNATVDGPNGPTDTRAMQIDADGAGPLDAISAGAIVTAETFDRKVGFGAWAYVPSPLANRNLDERIVEMIVTNNDTGEALEVVAADYIITDRWHILTASASIPSGVECGVELRVIALPGTWYVVDPVAVITEALDWDSIDVAEIIRDLIGHAYDSTFGHSDTDVRATIGSVPDIGTATSRTITSEAKRSVLDSINELATAGRLWHWLTAELDGTDLFHADEGNTASAALTGARIDPLTPWQTRRPVGVLGVFAPENIDITGERALDWWGPDGLLFIRGQAWDYGDEQYQSGPLGDYDPRFLDGILEPLYDNARHPLAVPVTSGRDSALLAAVCTNDLRVGSLVAVTTAAAWPRGVDGTFRVAQLTVKTDSWQVVVELNLDASGS